MKLIRESAVPRRGVSYRSRTPWPRKSTEISSKWTKDTLTKMSGVATMRDEPADYSKAMTDFASSQAESTAETLAAFAEIAKNVQMETVELMLSAGKDMSEDFTSAAKKWIGEKGYDPTYGARPLKRFLQKQVETQLARALVAGEVEEGSEVAFSVKDDELVMKVG